MTAHPHTAADFERDADLIDTYLATDTPEAIRQRVVAALRIAARVVDGWQVVPVEPTEAMIVVGDHEILAHLNDHSRFASATPTPAQDCYRAMLAAAPAIRAALTGGENG